jgi:hypothetical protein
LAGKGGEAALKRAREKARLEKQEAKRQRRRARRDADTTVDPTVERELMEEFARLNERHHHGQMSNDDFERERHRILVELGIEQDD